jgi:RNA polymerase sigma factor (sigma-70 family)
MNESEPYEVGFQEWMVRVRAGDVDATRELVRRYERSIRVAVQFHLTTPGLRRQFDSMDICQSVLGSFFFRAAAGQYDLQSPEQLVGLLVRIARNKLNEQIRCQKQLKRDIGRNEPMPIEETPIVSHDSRAEEQIEARELLDRLYARLTPDEHAVAALRSLGMTWQEIAQSLDQTEQAVRMRLTRAIDRVAGQLGLDSLALDK